MAILHYSTTINKLMGGSPTLKCLPLKQCLSDVINTADMALKNANEFLRSNVTIRVVKFGERFLFQMCGNVGTNVTT